MAEGFDPLSKSTQAYPEAVGVAIIIANDYSTCKALNTIQGPIDDASKAEAVFRSLKTVCHHVRNQNAARTIAACQFVASYEYPHDKFKWIIIVFSGHGNNETIIAQDGSNIPVQTIIDLFKHPPNLSIPKFFFFDACRGIELTESHLVPRGPEIVHMNPRGGELLSEVIRLPEGCNMLIAFSTLPRKYAYEQRSSGGLWLSKLLDRLPNDDSSITDILNEVNKDVVDHFQPMNGLMQQPEYRSTLLGKINFKRDAGIMDYSIIYYIKLQG